MANFNYEDNRILDVVNENDQVVDSKSRADIHRLGLLHREIHVWMFDKNYNVFFQKRGLHRPSAGLLDATVSGHVNKNEDYLVAAVRETKEETGISVLSSNLILLKKIKKNSPKKTNDSQITINNTIRCVYVYNHPIMEEQIKKESGLLGVDFRKISLNILLNQNKEDAVIFNKLIFTDELPLVLKYISNLLS